MAEGRIGKRKRGELLSLDEMSKLPRCFAWDSRELLRCDGRTSVEECLIKKLRRSRGIIFIGQSEYLCCVAHVRVRIPIAFEHPSSRERQESCWHPLVLPELQSSLPQRDTASTIHGKSAHISWVNLHLADLALCQLIWMERESLLWQGMRLILFSFI